MLLNVGDYVEGYEYYGTQIARVRGWITCIFVHENVVRIEIKCDDGYNGHRGSDLIYGDLNFPITKLGQEDSGKGYARYDLYTPYVLSERFMRGIHCFDIDGVLAEYRFGTGVYSCKESEFEAYVKKNDVYLNARAPKRIKELIEKLDCVEDVYVISKAYCNEEESQKIEFVVREYGIRKQHIYFVKKDTDKLDVLRSISNIHKDVEHDNIHMVDDSVAVLGHIYDNSDFDTVHISSLL